MNHPSRSFLKTASIGAISGALVFFGLSVVRGQGQPSLTARDVHANTRQYVGTRVSVTGTASGIRIENRSVKGQDVSYTKLNLYEMDSTQKKRTNYYIYVALPTSAFRFTPQEGDLVTIEGNLKWANMFAQIDE